MLTEALRAKLAGCRPRFRGNNLARFRWGGYNYPMALSPEVLTARIALRIAELKLAATRLAADIAAKRRTSTRAHDERVARLAQELILRSREDRPYDERAVRLAKEMMLRADRYDAAKQPPRRA